MNIGLSYWQVEARYTELRNHKPIANYELWPASGVFLAPLGDTVGLELGNLEPASVYSYGGFSANKEALVELQLQRKPTPEDLAEFDILCAKAGVTPGAWWLSPEGTRAVLERMEPHIKRLRERKAREAAAKNPHA